MKTTALRVALLSAVALAALVAAGPAAACACGELASGAGIRVTVVDERPGVLEADLDLTMYTRYPSPYPSTFAGAPFFGVPALDYGDGSTLSLTSLGLASTGAGPGGSNVYRSLASFTHTYPALGNYTVTAGMICSYCFRYAFSAAPVASPGTPTYTFTADYLPTTVVGNMILPYNYNYTYTSLDGYVLRYVYSYYLAITNTAEVVLEDPLAVPAASTWGLVLLGALLAAGGLFVLRRG